MHIALYSPSWPPAQAANGIVTYVDQMRRALLDAGHDVSIVAARAAAEPDVYAVPQTLETKLRRRLAHALGRPPAVAFGPALARTLRRLHARRPIDVIEMEESFGWASHVVRLGIPTVVKLHGPAFLSLVDEELSQPFAKPRIAAEGVALHGVDFITSPSRSTLGDTIDRYGLIAQTAYIPNPIDPGKYSEWRCEAADPDLVLFVGRFDKRKGGDRVLEAFKALLGQRPQARLVFVGPDRGLSQPDGSLTSFSEFVQTHFSAGESAHIEFRGALPPREVEALRLKARVTVIASRWENAPYAAIEALAQGCPVAAIECKGVDEVVLRNQTGLISPTSETLAQDLLLLMTDGARATELGRAARQFILTTHAPAVAVAAALRVYENSMASRNSGRAH